MIVAAAIFAVWALAATVFAVRERRRARRAVDAAAYEQARTMVLEQQALTLAELASEPIKLSRRRARRIQTEARVFLRAWNEL